MITMHIGWNAVTQQYDMLYSSDYKETGTIEVAHRRQTRGKKVTLSHHRYDRDSEVWDNSDTRIYWGWEPNS